MTAPEMHLVDLFEDLEQQAAALQAQERAEEVAEVSRAQYAEVDLASRLHASLGRRVQVHPGGAAPVSGELVRVGSDFCVVQSAHRPHRSWVVTLRHVCAVSGLSCGSVAEVARPVQGRLSIRSLLRRLGEEGSAVAVQTCEQTWRGRIGRVGADFFELQGGPGKDVADTPRLVGLGSVAVVEVGR